MRGQSNFIDFIAGFFIFTIALAISLTFLSSASEIPEPADTERMSNDLLSSGIPTDWNASNVAVAGVLSGSSVNKTKWNALRTMSADDIRTTLRTSSDVRIRMLTWVGNSYAEELPAIETGPLDQNATTIRTTNRIAAYNGSLVIIEVSAWR